MTCNDSWQNQNRKNSLFYPKVQKVQFPRPIRNERRKIGREEEEVEVKGIKKKDKQKYK